MTGFPFLVSTKICDEHVMRYVDSAGAAAAVMA